MQQHAAEFWLALSEPARTMPMKILLVSSELHPFSKSGGLADMVGALAKTLAADGTSGWRRHAVVSGHSRKISRAGEVRLDCWICRSATAPCDRAAFASPSRSTISPIYFVDQPGFFDRPSLYTDKGRGLSGQRRAIHFLLQGRGQSRALSSVETGIDSCPRLAGRARPLSSRATKAARRMGGCAAHLPDHP